MQNDLHLLDYLHYFILSACWNNENLYFLDFDDGIVSIVGFHYDYHLIVFLLDRKQSDPYCFLDRRRLESNEKEYMERDIFSYHLYIKLNKK